MFETGIQIIVFVFGAVVGSFLNVCIYRMPLGESVVQPGSHCPQCKKPIAWFDNIPLVSFLFLLGRCRSCKTRISPRYFLIELLTALVFVAMFRRYGAGFDFFFYTAFICGLIVATFVDFSHRIIPDEISIGGCVAGFVLTAVKSARWQPFSLSLAPVIDSALGIIVGGGSIFLIGFIFDLIYFKLLKKPPIQGETESMGGGDVKLLAMIGAFLGWKAAILTFFIAPFFGVLVGLANMLVRKDHLIPYGPFLSLAAVLVLFFQSQILRLFLLP